MIRKPPTPNKGLMIAIIVAIALLLAVSYAYAHSWYDPECCNDKDCMALPDGAVYHGLLGYHIIPLGEVVPYRSNRIKVSQDLYYHICQGMDFHDGHPEKQNLLTKDKFTRCLYVPTIGF